VLQEKQFRAPAPPLLVSAPVAVAASGLTDDGLAAGVAGGGAVSAAVAARGPACPGLAAGAVAALGTSVQLQPPALLPLGWRLVRRW
jgi:hypothetical protein